MIVEYAGVLAAVSILAMTLGGGYSKTLATIPTSNAAAIELVSAGARAQKVSVAGARNAYKRAPYAKPSLKYLHAVGWIGGRRNLNTCALTSITQGVATKHAEREIQRNTTVRSRLRARGIPARVAAATLVKGVVSACS